LFLCTVHELILQPTGELVGMAPSSMLRILIEMESGIFVLQVGLAHHRQESQPAVKPCGKNITEFKLNNFKIQARCRSCGRIMLKRARSEVTSL
jgi:hypothetical protein